MPPSKSGIGAKAVFIEWASRERADPWTACQGKPWNQFASTEVFNTEPTRANGGL